MRPNDTVHMREEEPSLIHGIRNFLRITRGQRKISDLGGNRTHDLRISSPLLYRLSSQGQTGEVCGSLRTNLIGSAQPNVISHVKGVLSYS